MTSSKPVDTPWSCHGEGLSERCDFIQNGEAAGETPTHYVHMAHHPNHARALKQRADKVGIEVVANAPEIGLVDPSGEDLVGFFICHLK